MTRQYFYKCRRTTPSAPTTVLRSLGPFCPAVTGTFSAALSSISDAGVDRDRDDVMGSSREYWDYARECARWATEAKDQAEQEMYVDMARAWTNIALVEADVLRLARREGHYKRLKPALHS